MITLRAMDFNRQAGNDMWSMLVEEAILNGMLPIGSDPEQVEELPVIVKDVGRNNRNTRKA